MNIVITGLTASGKSFQAKNLADKLSFNYIDASHILLKLLQSKQNIEKENKKHFWIRKKNAKLIEYLRKSDNLDVKVDRYMLRQCNLINDTIFESRTLPWRCENPKLLKIYLNASLEDRTAIAYNSKEIKEYSLKELKIKIDEKDKRDIERFKKLYGIDISNTEGFDLVLDNGKLSPDETQIELLKCVQGTSVLE